MIATIMIILFAAFIAYMEIPLLLKNKSKKELRTFSLLLLFGVTLSILHVLDMKLPTPLAWITIVYKPLSTLVSKLLE